MLDTINKTFLALAYLFLFVVLVLVAYAAVDQGFRDQLADVAEPYVMRWMSDRPAIAELQQKAETADSRIDSLQQENDKLRQQLSGMNEQMAGLDEQLAKATAEVEKEKAQLSSEFARLQEELDKEVSSREIAIEQVRDRFTVIRVGDKILFDTGSSKLKNRGKEVLELIAGALGKFPDRQVRVEGHTDNKPIKSAVVRKRYPTNWELSSARATAAVRYLIENGGLDPLRVIAVGLGEYHPIASNDTDDGRARNRRIEIVLMPAEDNYQVQEVNKL